MTIDWFTLAAQLINFFVLVGLLRWFLYTPVIRAMDKRESIVTSRLQEAEESHQRANQKVQEFEEKKNQFEIERDQLILQAKRDAQEQHQRLLAESREKVSANRQEWMEALTRERNQILDEFRAQVGQMAELAARQTLKTLASEDLEQRITRQFLLRFENLEDIALAEIRSHVINSGQPHVGIRTAFEISATAQNEIHQLVTSKLGKEVEIQFEASDEVICGIELDIVGFHFGWNLREYLRDLSLDFQDRLQKEDLV